LVIEQELDKLHCPDCSSRAFVKERPVVTYVDLPVFGTPMRLSWRKHRLWCPDQACARSSWTAGDHRIAAKSCLLTTRCAKWATRQVGGGRTVNEVAAELGCDWHTVNDAVTIYGAALLQADRKRLNTTTAIGLDETGFSKPNNRAHKSYVTTVADVENHQIIEILPTRDFTDVADWIDKQPKVWKERLRFGSLDMSNLYAAVYSVTLPELVQVIDPFHLVQLANRSLDQVRRRVQIEQLGHRGRKDDPLFRARRVLLMAEEKLDEEGTQRLMTLLETGDPNGEVALAHRIKERIRDFYAATDIDIARTILEEIQERCSRKAMPPELQKLGRTITKWFDKICNHHLARISNGPTEALNNLIKRIKRIGFGFRNFKNYRIRALLYAGKPNWRVLDSIVVR
jgi:transposase